MVDADLNRRLLATWDGKYLADGHATNRGFAGDYSEAFTIESGFTIDDQVIADQQQVIAALAELFEAAETPLERERLGYLYGQVGFMDPYAQAWREGVQLHQLIMAQQERRRSGDAEGAAATICEQGVPLWISMLQHTRAATLSFQHTVATRNDLGMLASVHNKFVRIATFRFRASLLEFVEELSPEAEAAYAATLAPDVDLPAALIVPTRPTRLGPGERATLTAIAPGTLEVSCVELQWRQLGSDAWRAIPMRFAGRRTYVYDFCMPSGTAAIEYRIHATFAAAPAPIVLIAPPAGGATSYVISQ